MKLQVAPKYKKTLEEHKNQVDSEQSTQIFPIMLVLPDICA